MNKEAIAEFLRVTYDAYAERYGDDFGSLVPAIFTDEPNYPGMGNMGDQVTLAWTPALRLCRNQHQGDHI
ncbi:MAG TPA: hypothetical protein ENL03_06540 [Phycisphaerae bacterium]|nr:hypothetical protein [Phycisphaerae bacterium]